MATTAPERVPKFRDESPFSFVRFVPKFSPMPIANAHPRRSLDARRRVASACLLAGGLIVGAAQPALADDRPVVKAATAPLTVDTAPLAGPIRVEAAASAGGITVPTTMPGKNRTAVVAGLPTAADILANPRISLTDRARADLVDGGIDRRLLAVLQRLAKSHTIMVTVLRSGHSQFVKGTDRVSNHIVGRGADIGRVDGQPVSIANPGAIDVLTQALAMPDSIRPTEIGGPIDIDSGDGVIGFTDSGHDDHVHLGFD